MFTEGPQVYIVNCDMPEAMQSAAISIARQAVIDKRTCREIASLLTKDFERLYRPTWHCIVDASASGLSSYVTYEAEHFIYFFVARVPILLFRTVT